MWLRFEGVVMLVGPYAEEMDASLQAQYSPRDPIGEFILGEISLRQLRVLAEGLPPTSALIRAQRGHSWGDLEYLVMDIANGMRSIRTEIPAYAAGNGKRPQKPDLIKPPPDIPTIESEAEEASQRRQAESFSVAVDALFANN